MFTVHDGDIILKEKHLLTSQEILYVKPPDQTNIVPIYVESNTDITRWFTRIFLPQGYPHSVSKDYLAYQVWDIAQAFCSTITGTLATQKLLREVGIGDTNATPLAATGTWVIKIGCCHLGTIFFSYTYGTHLDAFSKKWRMYADILHNASMCFEMALPLLDTCHTFALCISTFIKAIVGVAGGATRMVTMQHHAIQGNMADVLAKDYAQKTVVNLVASIAALLITSLFGNSFRNLFFLLLMVLHIVFNYLAVRTICLRTLNEPRYLQVINTYLVDEIIATPHEVNRKELIMFYQMGSNLLDLKLCGFNIKIGCSLKELAEDKPAALYYSKIKDIYRDFNYIINPNIRSRVMWILLKEDVETDDVLQAYFHAVMLALMCCAINNKKMPLYNSAKECSFTKTCNSIQCADWSRELVTTQTETEFRFEPSFELMRFVARMSSDQWEVVSAGLQTTGWDLTKHNLIRDEWYLCDTIIKPEMISKEVLQSHSISLHKMSQKLESSPDTTDENVIFTVNPED